ncbi:MAG: ATP-binding protein [Blastocatellia bacterium]|nr:ATP-binding protein [Blastocatellia bacterium]
MANRIRECISIAPYQPIDFSEHGWESRLLPEALMTYELGDVLQRLFEYITSTSHNQHAVILVGPPGSGKTYTTKLLQALLTQGGHPLPQAHNRLKELHALIARRTFLTLELSQQTAEAVTVSQPGLEYIKHYLRHLATTANTNEALNLQAAVDEIGTAFKSLPGDTTLLVVIDSLESWLKSRDFQRGQRIVNLLRVLSAASQKFPLALLTNINDRALDSVNYDWLTGEQVMQMMGSCHLEYLSGNAIPALIGVHLVSKNARQRTLISKVREQLLVSLPELKLDEQELINLYPLHPAVWKIGSRLRPYLESFSFPAFATKAADKIKNRPAESLYTVDEMHDLLEAGLRSNPQLAYAFKAYDRTIEAVLPRVSQNQRLHTRMLIKAILMHTLAGQPATVRDLTNSILFYDLTGKNQSYALAAAVLKQIRSLSKSVEAEGEELECQYRFPLHEGQVLEERIAALARDLPNTDTSIGITVLLCGAGFFEDWPIEVAVKGEVVWQPRYTHIWHIAKQDTTGFIVQPAQPETTMPLRQSPIFSISIDFPVVSKEPKTFDMPDSQRPSPGSIFVRWVPSILDLEDIWTIKQLVVLRSLTRHQTTLSDEAAKIEHRLRTEVERIFRRNYLERGEFQFRDGASGRVPVPQGEMPWSLNTWLLPLTSPVIPEDEIPADELLPETVEWVSYLLAPTQTQAADFRPTSLGEALGGLAGYFQNWQRRDVSRVMEKLRKAPPTATDVQRCLAAERLFEKTAFHVRHAIAQKSLNEEFEEVMYLFDSDPDNFWQAREMMERIYDFNSIAAEYETKIEYVKASVPTSDLFMEKLKYEMLSQQGALWQFFDPQVRHRFDLHFVTYQPLYIDFYVRLHQEASDPAVIEPLCQEIVSGEEWNNLEMISQLTISRQDFHVDAINQISMIYQMICTEDVPDRLAKHPICICGFHPDDANRLSVAAERTRRYVKRGIEIHRDMLRARRAELRDKLKARKERKADTIRIIAAILESGDMPRLNDEVIRTLNEILEE